MTFIKLCIYVNVYMKTQLLRLPKLAFMMYMMMFN